MKMTDPPHAPLSQPARRNVLDQLKIAGPQSAADMADALNVTAVAVRQHLQALEEEGLVTSTSESIGRGRPKRIWALTDDAARIFPDAHQSLAVELIRSVETLYGADGLAAVAERHAAVQQASYAARMTSATSLQDRIAALVEARSAEGYMAAMAQDGEDWLFMENHCPICSAASACTNLCANELEMIQSLLGADVHVSRDEHILAGARRCLYRISKPS
tara:strand:+ start:320 stop:976 length:657 start_codon:yes stop_codon:yes gene_type:complete